MNEEWAWMDRLKKVFLVQEDTLDKNRHMGHRSFFKNKTKHMYSKKNAKYLSSVKQESCHFPNIPF